jgi:hypothetical protein
MVATTLRYAKGHSFLDNNGAVLASGTITYYRAGTTTLQNIYSDADGATALPNPITLNSAGRAVDGSNALVAIYLSDAGGFDYKEVVATSSGTVLWTDDDIPIPIDLTASLSDFAKPRIQYLTDTAASVTLTAGLLGSGRLASSGSNSITYAPIAASTAGNGNGYLIKKVNAANTVTFDPDGSDLVDGAATFSWTGDDEAYWFISDGANWQVAPSHRTIPGIFFGINSLTEDTSPDEAADFLVTYDTSASEAKKVLPINLATLLTLGTAQATTSGTSFDFTGIPTNTKIIYMMLDQVSLSGTDELLVQIGDSGGLETTNYDSVSGTRALEVTSTSGFIIKDAIAAASVSGIIILQLCDNSNTWVSSHNVNRNANAPVFGAGRKQLSATIDRLRLLATGANTFDGGQVNIMYGR